MTGLVLIAAAAVLGWYVLRAIFVPYQACRWCRGSGNNPFSNGTRQGDCWICRGRPRRMTHGARLVRGQGWRRK